MSAHALQVWAGWNTFNYRNTHCPEMAVPHRCQNCPHFPSRDKTPQLAPCNAVQEYPKSPITCPSDHPITGLTTKASQRSDYPSLTSAHTPTFKRNEETPGRKSTEGFICGSRGISPLFRSVAGQSMYSTRLPCAVTRFVTRPPSHSTKTAKEKA